MFIKKEVGSIALLCRYFFLPRLDGYSLHINFMLCILQNSIDFSLLFNQSGIVEVL